MKKDLQAKLLNGKIRKPSPFLMTVGLWILKRINKRHRVKFHYDYDPKALQNTPTVLLSSHASRLEFMYTVYGFKRKDLNVVCGYQNILKKGLFSLFLKLGVISKYLYQPDLVCVKKMLKVLRRGGAIGLFPEGIQSTSGSTHPINPATAQFIKTSRANIVVCRSSGAYLATNRYSSDRKKGYIGIEYSLVFTPEMLNTLTEEEIYQTLLEKIRYNDFAFNKEARHTYVGKKPNAFGIDKILYLCPECKSEHTLTVQNDTLVCKTCHFAVTVNEYYDLIGVCGKRFPADIDAWYKWQRRCVASEIQNEDFKLSLTGSLCTLRTDKLKKPPKNRRLLSKGEATLKRDGLSFSGVLDGQPADFTFPAKSLFSMTLSTRGYLEFYHNNNYYMLVPDDSRNTLIKWTLASEEIHNLYDERWQKACADVYDYEKGEIYE